MQSIDTVFTLQMCISLSLKTKECDFGQGRIVFAVLRTRVCILNGKAQGVATVEGHHLGQCKVLCAAVIFQLEGTEGRKMCIRDRLMIHL